jgi:hypothetical protein
MKVWKLARINMVTPVPAGETRAVVLIARTAEGARQLAMEAAGIEGPRTWLDIDQTNCWSFGTADESYQVPGLICTDRVEG